MRVVKFCLLKKIGNYDCFFYKKSISLITQ